MKYTPYTEIKNSKIELPNNAIEVVECEIIDEESRFIGGDIWGDNETHEVENSLTRVLIIFLIIAIIYFLIKSILTPKKS